MVVVPPFAGGEHRRHGVVARVVDRVEAARAEQVVDGVDGEGRVRQRDRRHAEAPHEPLEAAGEIHGRGQRERRREVVAVEPRDFRTPPKSRITALLGFDAVVARVVQEPADVRVVEPADRRAVRIAFAVGEPVMVHVMAGPPERPLLHRGRADQGPDESRDAIHLKRAVREVAVERERQADRAREMRHRPEGGQRPRERHEEREQRRTPARSRTQR